MVYGYRRFQDALISRNLCIASAVFTRLAPKIRLFFAYGLKSAEARKTVERYMLERWNVRSKEGRLLARRRGDEDMPASESGPYNAGKMPALRNTGKGKAKA